MGATWTQTVKEEITIQKLLLSPRKPELLLQPQWNIPPWAWLVYRFSMLVYTFGWCVFTGLLFNTPKWLIYLSHINYCIMGLYYLSAVFNLAAAFVLVRFLCRQEQRNSYFDSPSTFPLPAALGTSLRVQWFLHTVQGSFSLTVFFLYWIVSYPMPYHPLSAFNINLHLFNSIQAMVQTLLDLVLSATPIHLCHYPYLALTGSLYILFGFLYWLGDLTNIRGQPYIYKLLDFGGCPVSTTLSALGFILVFLPLFHFTLWNVYLLRDWLSAGRCALQRETWWWGAVVGGDSPLTVPSLDPAVTLFGAARGKPRGDEPQSRLPMTTSSYQTVSTSA